MIVDIIFVLGVLQVLQQPVQVECQLSGGQEILIENSPWHVYIMTEKRSCNGVLISSDYVILPAECVIGSRTAKAFLGFQHNPIFESNHKDNNTQVINSNQIIVHEDFKNVTMFGYHNNIALVQLVAPAKLTHTVQPGILARDVSQLVDGQLLHLTFWNSSLPGDLTLANVNFQKETMCVDIIKDNYLKDQELCFKNQNKNIYSFGNSVCLDNTIVGFLTKPCTDKNMLCKYNLYIALNIVPYLNWISWKTKIDKATLTGDHYQLLRKTLTALDNIAFKLEKNTDSINNFEERLKRMETAEINMRKYEEINMKYDEINMQYKETIKKLVDISRQAGEMHQQVAHLSNKTQCLAGGFFLST